MKYGIWLPNYQTTLSRQANGDSGNELILPAFLTARSFRTSSQASESRCVQSARTFRLRYRYGTGSGSDRAPTEKALPMAGAPAPPPPPPHPGPHAPPLPTVTKFIDEFM